MQFLVLESGVKPSAAVGSEMVPSECGIEARAVRASALDRHQLQDGFATCTWMNPEHIRSSVFANELQ